MKLQTSILAKVISSLFPQRLPSRRVIIRLFLLLIAITVTGLYQPSVHFFQPFPRPAIIKQFRYWPEKKKIAQLKNTRENENSSYSVDLYTLCITLKMFKREPTSYFPVFGDTKIQTHVLASFCTKIAQLQDKKNFKQVWLQDQEPGKHEYQHCHQIFLCKSANLNAPSFFVCMKTGRVTYS